MQGIITFNKEKMNQHHPSFLDNIPPVVKNLLIINVLFFLATFVFEQALNINLDEYLGLHFFRSRDFKIWQLVSYMFMHGSFTHLFFNMFALYMFGSVLEYTWGSKRFLIFYFITGIGAGLVQELVCAIRLYPLLSQLTPEAVELIKNEGRDVLLSGKNYANSVMGDFNLIYNTITVGASGSIFGLLLAFGMLFPNQPLYFMFIPVPIKAKYFVIGYAILELLLGVGNFQSDNVAHFAHLGGMFFGYFLIRKWKRDANNHQLFG